MKRRHLNQSKADFAKFIENQRSLWTTQGSPRGLIMCGEDFQWLETWEKIEAKFKMTDDIDVANMRFWHHAGWMDGIKQFDA